MGTGQVAVEEGTDRVVEAGTDLATAMEDTGPVVEVRVDTDLATAMEDTGPVVVVKGDTGLAAVVRVDTDLVAGV